VIALDARRFGIGARLGDDHLDAAAGEVDRERQADRARADDDDVCFLDFHRNVGRTDLNRA
jgi:hypothetical protein